MLDPGDRFKIPGWAIRPLRQRLREKGVDRCRRSCLALATAFVSLGDATRSTGYGMERFSATCRGVERRRERGPADG